MLQFFRKDNTYIDTIESHGFDTWTYGQVNTVSIKGSPEQYLGTLCYIYLDGTILGSGIVANYKYNKNTNSSTIDIHPLISDLGSDVIGTFNDYLLYEDSDTLEMESGDTMAIGDITMADLTVSGDLSDSIEQIINLYRVGSFFDLIYVKSKQASGINFTYTFQNSTILDAYNFLVERLGGIVIINSDGGIDINPSPVIHEFSYGSDVLKIEYEKDISEIINCIYFTNGSTITKTYLDETSIASYGKRVKYMSDSRFTIEASADEYIASIFEKSAVPTVRVDSIKTLQTNIKVGDRVSISNWEKNFPDNLFVNSITYDNEGFLTLDIGTKLTRTELLS